MKKLIPALICLIFILSGCNAKPDTSAAVQSAEDLPDTMQTTTIEDVTYYNGVKRIVQQGDFMEDSKLRWIAYRG